MKIYEQWTYDTLESEGFAVFVPYKDRGVDCVVIGKKDFRGRPQRIQIKGSKGYNYGKEAWYQVREDAVNPSATDFWIFVWPHIGTKGKFKPRFLVIPTHDLLVKLKQYAKTSRNMFNIYSEYAEPGSSEGSSEIFDTRAGNDSGPDRYSPNSPRDYSAYLDNLDRIRTAL